MTTVKAHPSRGPLALNSVFSVLSGTLIAIAPRTVGGWLGFSADGWLRLFGLALIGHGVLLAWAARHPDPTPLARLNLLAIAPYPLLMIGLIVAGVIDRTVGQGLALLDGAIIAAIAFWHWTSLREPAPVAQTQPA